ncbi:MAG: LPS-assembly protein LptD [Gammaproteobacteria bacterium]|nr:LPS-assembly protein LptD [Gammaproteobacteria bacterium]
MRGLPLRFALTFGQPKAPLLHHACQTLLNFQDLIRGSLALAISACAFAAPAEPETDGASAEGPLAERFWVDWAQLTSAERSRHPAWCSGAYRFPGPLTAPSDSKVRAESDSAAYLSDGTVELGGSVVIAQGARLVRTDRALINSEADTATAPGVVRISDADVMMQGAAAVVRLDSRAARLNDAQIVLTGPQLRGHADAVERQGDGDIRLTRARFTRCEPGNGSWRIDARSLHLPDGEVFGTARGAVLRVKGVPLAWLPYMKFPVSEQRQSGSLFPHIGASGEDGIDLALPYYLNLAPNYDATVTPRLLGKRGVGAGGEARHLSRRDRTRLFGGYLANDQRYDGELERDDWRELQAAGAFQGEEFDPAGRWFAGIEHRGQAGRFSSFINYAAVSDRDYFRVFDGAVSDRGRFNLERYGEINYRHGAFSARLWGQGFQRLDEIRRPEYRRLPEINIGYQGLGLGPLRLSLDARGAAFDRNTENLRGIDALTGERLHLEPRLSLPLHWPFGFLHARAGYRHTAYALDSKAERLEDDSPERSIFYGSLDGGLIFERDLDAFATPLVQTLEPRLRYFRQGYEDQDRLPRFDAKALTFSYRQLFRDNRFAGLDRISDANELTVGVTSRFLNRTNGREYLYASLGQTFHFRDRRVTLSGRPGDDERHGASAISGEIGGEFARRWRLTGALAWDTGDSQLDEAAAALSYRRDNQRILNLGYRRLAGGIDQTDVSLHWPVTRRYAVFGRWNHDLKLGRTIEGLVGIEYNDCCWRLRLVARRHLDHAAARSLDSVDPDSGFYLQMLFKGLGAFGGRVDSILERSIRGYRSTPYSLSEGR